MDGNTELPQQHDSHEIVPEEPETIRADWSAGIVHRANLDDLDELACKGAREAFAKKHADQYSTDEVESWSLEALLDRAKVTRDGKITRTALLLLGEMEAAHYLNPNPAQISWKVEGPERAYEHFRPPFFLATKEIVKRIRNYGLKFLPKGEMIARQVWKYDETFMLEALHNCIAHQDYRQCGRIIVAEHVSKLTFEQSGAFFEGNWENYVEGSKKPSRYRNPFLVQAMRELNMIDAEGHGIHRMFDSQRSRYLPLPDYAFSRACTCLTLHGNIMDLAYTRALVKHPELSMRDVQALDRVQKRLPISRNDVARLRRAKLVEGRKSNLYISGSEVPRPPGDQQCEEAILEYIRKHGGVSRAELNSKLGKAFDGELDENQKRNKIDSLIKKLRSSKRIVGVGVRNRPVWKLGQEA